MSIAFVVCFFVGCYGMAHYETPPPQIDQYGTGEQPVKPDIFMVRSNDYPKYGAVEKIKPPNLVLRSYGNPEIVFVDIEKSDTWEVTHKVGERYIIQSEEYNKRQIQSRNEYYKRKGYNTFFGRVTDPHVYGIYINAGGEVDGGWEQLPSSKLLGSNRYMYMLWHPAKNDGWPKGAVFRPKKK